MNVRKEDLIYVGIDLHKETHTAVILDCWNTKLGEITFANTPAEFPKLVRKVKKYCIENKQAVYGLENAYGYGRYLITKNGTYKAVLDMNQMGEAMSHIYYLNSLIQNVLSSIRESGEL
ncbi:MAG: transposase [Lachnospiraceae bacterium]|nr:transposase [Lachnospiraceae bacterium]